MFSRPESDRGGPMCRGIVPAVWLCSPSTVDWSSEPSYLIADSRFKSISGIQIVHPARIVKYGDVINVYLQFFSFAVTLLLRPEIADCSRSLSFSSPITSRNPHRIVMALYRFSFQRAVNLNPRNICARRLSECAWRAFVSGRFSAIVYSCHASGRVLRGISTSRCD